LPFLIEEGCVLVHDFHLVYVDWNIFGWKWNCNCNVVSNL